jgi:hypothetical protein
MADIGLGAIHYTIGKQRIFLFQQSWQGNTSKPKE